MPKNTKNVAHLRGLSYQPSVAMVGYYCRGYYHIDVAPWLVFNYQYHVVRNYREVGGYFSLNWAGRPLPCHYRNTWRMSMWQLWMCPIVTCQSTWRPSDIIEYPWGEYLRGNCYRFYKFDKACNSSFRQTGKVLYDYFLLRIISACTFCILNKDITYKATFSAATSLQENAYEFHQIQLCLRELTCNPFWYTPLFKGFLDSKADFMDFSCFSSLGWQHNRQSPYFWLSVGWCQPSLISPNVVNVVYSNIHTYIWGDMIYSIYTYLSSWRRGGFQLKCYMQLHCKLRYSFGIKLHENYRLPIVTVINVLISDHV